MSVQALRCSQCAAPVQDGQDRCGYCGFYFKPQSKPVKPSVRPTMNGYFEMDVKHLIGEFDSSGLMTIHDAKELNIHTSAFRQLREIQAPSNTLRGTLTAWGIGLLVSLAFFAVGMLLH
jgi:hypothetical protein